MNSKKLLFFSSTECFLKCYDKSNVMMIVSFLKNTNNVKTENIFGNVVIPKLPISLKIDCICKGSNQLKLLVQSKEKNIKAYKSGIRSCLLFQNGIVLRLKGCGNNDDGFILRRINNNKNELYEVRGCMFKNTCLQEFMIYYKVNDYFIDNNIVPINIPKGIFNYKDQEKFGFDKYCAIYETKGDKRLNDHLLIGLEKLIQCCDIKINSIELLKEVFEKKRKKKLDNCNEYVTWFVEVNKENEDFDDSDDYVNILTDFNDFKINFPKIIPDNVSNDLKDFWIENIIALSNLKIEKLFPYLFWRIGMEAGRILSILHQNNISWGTYDDMLGSHCNAHPSNYVILSQDYSNEDNFILSPLDFDMAFEKEYYTGEIEFVQLLKNEKKFMIISLGGFAINSGSKGSISFKDESIELFKWSLRDTMIKGFLIGYDEEKYKKYDYSFEKELNFQKRDIYSLISLCLILTEKEIS